MPSPTRARPRSKGHSRSSTLGARRVAREDALKRNPRFAACRAPFCRAQVAARDKTERAPERPVSAHEAAGDLGVVLSRESEVTVLVAPLALERGLSPHDGELREALVRVDERIADALMSCLAVDQAARPAPETMRDELDGFGERYVEDVRHALAGEPLTPVASAVQARRQGARRAARVIAWVVCPGAAVGVAGPSAWLADGGGTGGPWVPAALLASPHRSGRARPRCDEEEPSQTRVRKRDAARNRPGLRRHALGPDRQRVSSARSSRRPARVRNRHVARAHDRLRVHTRRGTRRETATVGPGRAWVSRGTEAPPAVRGWQVARGSPFAAGRGSAARAGLNVRCRAIAGGASRALPVSSRRIDRIS